MTLRPLFPRCFGEDRLRIPTIYIGILCTIIVTKDILILIVVSCISLVNNL
nr:MAG TPA: hypothetical protein [Bacteriophage sp.]